MNHSRTRSESLTTIRIHWQQIVFSLFILVAVLAVGQARAATTIVGSGLWNTTLSFPSCSYTQVGTLNISYASGAYSATYNASTALEDVCATSGPWSCNQTGFFAAEDLLSESQFRDALDVLMLSCAPPATAQSAKFDSADSVSGTGDYGGLAFTFQLTRATSTLYALTVTNTESGYGSVASSPGGISCYVPEPNVSYLVAPDCSESYPAGTTVTLTATPADGSFFYGWNGDCSGKEACTVTMDEAKTITARFKPIPFEVTKTGVTDDDRIITPIATVTTTITFNLEDVGKEGAVFVTAWAPYAALDSLGVSTLSNAMANVTSTLDDPHAISANELRVTVDTLAATDPSSFILLQLTPSGWQLVVSGQLIPYASGVLGDQLAAQTILNNTNTANLPGTEFCLGYGTSAAEMIAAERIQVVATVPDPNAAGVALGSCVALFPNALPVYRFFNNNAGGHFFTLNEDEKNIVIANFPWFRYEGVGFYAYATQVPGTSPVYRFFNNNAGGHFFTISEEEKTAVIDNYNWFRFEGAGFYAYQSRVAGTSPVYRFFNNNAGGHFFTVSEAEKTTVIDNFNWFRFEGSGFFSRTTAQ